MDYTQQIIGYHANSREKCEKYLNDNVFILSNDKEWLGSGMYFWDNQSNLKYWANEKRRKGETSDVWAIQALISLNNLLDLTDEDILTKFNELWEKFMALKKGCHKGVYVRESKFGVKLDLMFDYYKDLDRQIKLIKAVGFYERKQKKPFLAGSKLTNKIKILYCARELSVILDKERFTGI